MEKLVPWIPLLTAAILAPVIVRLMQLPGLLSVFMFLAVAVVGASVSFRVDSDWQDGRAEK